MSEAFRPVSSRIAVVAIAAMLALMLGVQFASMRLEAQTTDEAVYLAAGLSYWVTGDIRVNGEHPPLQKLVSAIPLLPLHLDAHIGTPLWARLGTPTLDEYYFGQDVLYNNRTGWQEILFLGRLPTLAITLLFGVTVAVWTWRRAGPWAAVIAAALFAFDPTLIAHGRYATNDVWIAFFIFVACISWDAALVRRTSVLLYAAAGVAMGCAFGTKASAIVLPVVFITLAIVRAMSWREALRAGGIAVAATVAVVALLYRGALAGYAGGFMFQYDHFQAGHLAYLFGEKSQSGWWYYYPVVFLIKTPLATLLLALATIAVLVRTKRVPVDIAVLVSLIAWYAAVCLFSHVNIGVRYLLPISAPLFACIAIILARSAPRGLIAAALLSLAIESLTAFPDYLPFINIAFGGPNNGPRYLLDSNVDWGQDTLKLKWWLDARNIGSIYFAYFGAQPRTSMGFTYSDIPAGSGTDPQRLNGVVAASAQQLYLREDLAWLRTRTPIARIGHSIYVYDFRIAQRLNL